MHILMILLLCFAQQMQPDTVQPSTQHIVKGSIENINGHRIVNLWGSHYEMGFAHGYLLGDEVMECFDLIFLGLIVSPSDYVSNWLPMSQQYFVLPPEYEAELKGMLEGMKARGVSLYNQKLSRVIGLDDLFAMNLACDLDGYWCSAAAGWGDATLDDPELKGGSLMVRNWDNPFHNWMNTHGVIFVFQSSSPLEKRVISVNWPGQIVIFTGFNTDGVAAIGNDGNYRGYDKLYPKYFYPMGLSVRDGLEDRDVDGDGYETHLDVYHAVSIRPAINCMEVLVLSPYPVPGHPGTGAGAVVEINYWGQALRKASHNMDYSPLLGSEDLIAVTNHDRLLNPPAGCSRYDHQVNQLSIDFKVDTNELWNIQAGISYTYTLQMVAFRPNLLDMFVAFNETGQGAHNSKKNYYKLADLFPNH